MFVKPTSKASLFNKRLCLATTLVVVKFTIVTDMIWVTLKSDLHVWQTHLKGQFVEQKVVLSSNFRCGQIYNGQNIIWVTLKSDLHVRQTHLRGQFVEQKVVLSCSFKCDRIHNNHCHESSPTLSCCVCQTYMFDKPTLEAGLLNKRWYLAPTLGVAKFIMVTDMIWVTLKSDLHVWQTHLKGQKVVLSSNFRCDQIHNGHWYDLGYT